MIIIVVLISILLASGIHCRHDVSTDVLRNRPVSTKCTQHLAFTAARISPGYRIYINIDDMVCVFDEYVCKYRPSVFIFFGEASCSNITGATVLRLPQLWPPYLAPTLHGMLPMLLLLMLLRWRHLPPMAGWLPLRCSSLLLLLLVDCRPACHCWTIAA